MKEKMNIFVGAFNAYFRQIAAVHQTQNGYKKRPK
jgi:hypothetical protein